MSTEREIIVALDVGTSKVAVIVAEVTAPQSIEIVGVGTAPSRGMEKGLVVDIGKLSECIEKAVSEAETMADCLIRTVFAGISGSHVSSLSSQGLVSGTRREITGEDVNRAMETAKQYRFDGDNQLLHAIARDFTVDGMGGIKTPDGMSGVRLEVTVHLIACSVTALQNVRNCLARCNLVAEQIILEQLASSYAVLSEDEQELGVCLVDIGGGTTDIAVFYDGAIQETLVIPIAGDHVTKDIAIALRTPTRSAEDLKIRHGAALASLVDTQEEIDVPGVGERALRRMSRQALAEVIQPRYEELFSLVHHALQEARCTERLVSGIVLSGGSCLIPGAVELAEEIFHMPVRRGAPHQVKGFEDMLANPIYATGIGLLHYGLRHRDDAGHRPYRNVLSSLWAKIKGNL